MWINTNKDYQVESLSKEKYRITQTNKNQLWGEYTVKIIIQMQENSWIITAIDTKSN